MFCSDKWKKQVFRRFLKQKFNAESYQVLMGFSTDEIHRAGRIKQTKKYHHQYPLLDLQINRNQCAALVERTFNSAPPKSSCIFCPNHKQSEWIDVKSSCDWEKLIEIDSKIRTANAKNGIERQFITPDCKPINEVDFDEKNEVIFSRTCAGECFL